MAMSTFWRIAGFICLVPCGLLTAGHEQMSPLTFTCTGENEVVFLEHGKNIQDVCDGEFELTFNGSHTSLLDGKLMFYFSSLPDKMLGVHLHDTPYDMGSVSAEWSLSSHVNINQNEIPCGVGYLLAVVDDYGTTYEGVQRAVRTCDFSDIDLALEVQMTNPNRTIDLTVGGMSLMDQLANQGAPIHMVKVRNNGVSRMHNFTLENHNFVMAFFRRSNTSETRTHSCMVPSFTLGDTMLGVMMFTEGIEPNQALELQEDPDMPISVNFNNGFAICGDAELVLLLDPMGMLNDSIPCNNFVKLPVHVDCGHSERKDVCMVVPNSIEVGREAAMMYQDMHSNIIKMYKYQVGEKTWDGMDMHDHTEQAGLAKFILMKKILSRVHKGTYHPMFPCKTVMPLVKSMLMFDRIMGQSNYTMDQARLNRISDLMTRLNDMNVMANNDGLRSDIEQFGNDTYNVMNDVVRMRISGISMGLQHAMSIKYAMEMSKMYGRPIPENMTRTTLGPAIGALALILGSLSEQSPIMQRYMIPTMVNYAATVTTLIHTHMFNLPDGIYNNLENMLYNLMDFPEEILDAYNDTVSSKCGRSLLRRMAMYLHYLSEGHDGETESTLDQEACNMMMVSSYLRFGGAYVVAKDIYDEVVKDMDQDVPSECRGHPYMPKKNPPVMWKTKDGYMWMGKYSPLADRITWKAVAVCRCDGCPGSKGSTYGYSATTSSWAWNNDQTTYGG